MLPQIFPYTVAEGLFAQQAGEHAHHDGSLVIDYISINESGGGEVREIPADGIGPGRTVLRIGRQVEVPEVPQGDVHLREKRGRYLRPEVIGIDLLGPDIVEPAHRDGVPEPEVRSLVRYQLDPREPLRGRGSGAEEHPLVVEKNGARMLHPAELEAGDDDEVVLRERVRDAGVGFQPVQGLEHLREDIIYLGDLGGVSLPEIDAQGLPVPEAGLLLPLPGREGKKIGAQRRGLAITYGLAPFRQADGLFRSVRHGFPGLRDVEAERKPALEVRLVEAGEDGPRPVRDEKGVQIIPVAVERPVSRDEGNFHAVLPLPEEPPVQHYMFAPVIYRAVGAVHFQPGDGIPAFTEIQLYGSPAAEEKGDGPVTCHPLRLLRRNAESEIVAET